MKPTDPPVLKRLGPVPFWRGEQKCLSVLEPIYRRAMECARAALGRAASGRGDDEAGEAK